MDGKIYVLGGEEGWDRYHNSIECYDPDLDKWQICGEMITSRSWLSCVPLQVCSKSLVVKSVKSDPSLIFEGCTLEDFPLVV